MEKFIIEGTKETELTEREKHYFIPENIVDVIVTVRCIDGHVSNLKLNSDEFEIKVEETEDFVYTPNSAIQPKKRGFDFLDELNDLTERGIV